MITSPNQLEPVAFVDAVAAIFEFSKFRPPLEAQGSVNCICRTSCSRDCSSCAARAAQDAQKELRKDLKAGCQVELVHKGFAVLTATRNPLIKQGVSVGIWLPKGVVLAPFGSLLATIMATTPIRPRFLKKRLNGRQVLGCFLPR